MSRRYVPRQSEGRRGEGKGEGSRRGKEEEGKWEREREREREAGISWEVIWRPRQSEMMGRERESGRGRLDASLGGKSRNRCLLRSGSLQGGRGLMLPVEEDRGL